MAKRSPILGYNHNVRYRGLVFHVQTEDSGLMSPHLFTHLFHGGVIISTRKLVYDAGSAEEAIKALMQAQHKAVLKDLKKGTFDDKIDQYLGDTEGLLPRGSVDPGEAPIRDSEPVMPAPPARTQTADRKSAPTQVKTSLPPPPPPVDGFDLPTVTDDAASIAAAVAAANATVRTQLPAALDSSPEITLQLDADEPYLEPGARARSKHDTDVQMPTERDLRAATVSDGVPGAIGASPSTRARAPGESVPPLTPERRTGDRGSAVGAASLPPARPISRPPSRPAITPPMVVSRPLTEDPSRGGRRESDAVEVYAPAPPSADIPPGAERPGQYAQHKRASQSQKFSVPVEAIRAERERSGSVPIPSGLARPGRPPTVPHPNPQSGPVPRQAPRETAPVGSRPAQRPRTATPARFAPQSGSGPTASRPGPGSGGVVTTRPAVIVGAPAKPAVPARVRKAREDEGRGFGQGLISEKSLDEVILAYLSEDADDK